MQLYRWCKSGKLLPLRRGMYAFSQNYSRKTINPAELANRLYMPSYISTYWALGYFGLIPEKVVTYTSITARIPKTFENAFGTFKYQHIKAAAFFGYRPMQINERKVFLAEPEKALLDLWHLEMGKWEEGRMAEMRFQNFEMINLKRLCEYSARFNSPRLLAATSQWLRLSNSQSQGTIEL